jgi:hypothetical protein
MPFHLANGRAHLAAPSITKEIKTVKKDRRFYSDICLNIFKINENDFYADISSNPGKIFNKLFLRSFKEVDGTSLTIKMPNVSSLTIKY